MKIVSGHQPVYLPWLGLFHKLHLCDVFVYMDTVQFLRQDWNNRNKIRTPHGHTMLTVPIDKKKTQGDNLDEVYIRQGDLTDRKFWQHQHFTNIQLNHKKTPFYNDYIEELEEMYMGKVWDRLIDLCWAQFELFRNWLGLTDKEVVRMTEHEFSGYKDGLVLNHCEQLNGDHVVFGTHGRDYVDVSKFNEKGIKVYFQDFNHPTYKQRFTPFEPYMSILDILFNHGPESMDIILDNNVTYDELKSNPDLWN